MTETYTPKKGDRVRVTIEGAVGQVSPGWFDLGVTCIPASLEHQEGAKYSVEKLSDPEPQWVNGDVVKVAGWRLGYFFDGAWHSAERSLHIFSGAGGSAITLSDYWKRGEVEILVKDGELVTEAA